MPPPKPRKGRRCCPWRCPNRPGRAADNLCVISAIMRAPSGPARNGKQDRAGMAMSKHFEEDGVSFDYPESWRLEREDADDGWTVAVQSPGTAFLTVTLDARTPTTEDVAETVLETLRSDYPNLEAEARV